MAVNRFPIYDHLKPIPDRVDWGMTNQYTWNDRIIFSKYRVVYGYRLRVGYVSLMGSCSELDICCGAQQEPFDEMFYKVTSIIIHNPPNKPFKGIPPFSDIKPYFNDDKFMDIIDALCDLHNIPK